MLRWVSKSVFREFTNYELLYKVGVLKTDRATDVGGADVYIGIISGSISGNVLVSNESDVINMLIMMRVRYAR